MQVIMHAWPALHETIKNRPPLQASNTSEPQLANWNGS